MTKVNLSVIQYQNILHNTMKGTSSKVLSDLLRYISNDLYDCGISDIIFGPTLTKYSLKLLAVVFRSKQSVYRIQYFDNVEYFVDV